LNYNPSMKKQLILLLLSLCLISGVNAITEPDDYYSSLCISEQSIGFHRINGIYKESNWIKNNYIISKKESSAENCPKDVNNLQLAVSMDSSDNIIRAETDACYNIKIFGEEFQNRQTRKCREIWDSPPDKGYFRLLKVTCYPEPESQNSGYFIFKPNGAFERSSLMGPYSLMSEPASLVLTVGKCSTL
jgi:hypothetical protein